MFSAASISLTRDEWQGQAWIGYATEPYDWLIHQKATFLNHRELQDFLQLRLQRRKYSYLLGRFTAKKVLDHFIPEFTMTDWWISAGVFTQPILFGPKSSTIQMSITHTLRYSYVLIYPVHHPMAVDAEQIKSGNFEKIYSQLTLSEREYCRSFSSADMMATMHWTAKEALSKTLRTGMMTPYNMFEIEHTEFKEGLWYQYFRNFAQYKAVSLESKRQIVTIVIPKNTESSNLPLLTKNEANLKKVTE